MALILKVSNLFWYCFFYFFILYFLFIFIWQMTIEKIFGGTKLKNC